MVRYEVRDGAAVITVDNPPVNALGPGTAEAIEEAVARAAADPEANAVVLTGAGTTFIAGADIRIFAGITSREASIARSRAVHARLRRIEDCPKPLVAAIHGTALGGGLEVAMACHYRVASPDARVGQPEVTLGIIPGAGGTQRLPRLAGVATALHMCTLGQHMAASRALSEGILDQLADGDLVPAAIAFARGRPVRKTRDLDAKLGSPEDGLAACRSAREKLAGTARGATAPFRAVEAIEAALAGDFDAGCEREIELFAGCVLSNESRNLVRLFFAERECARIPDIPKHTPAPEIRSAAVVGAGTMGGGIAMAYVNAGIPVLLKDSGRQALDRGMESIRRNYQNSVARGRMTPEQFERAMLLIHPTLSYDGFETVDIVVEAVYEDLAVKRPVFAELGRITRPDCILASNTSTLDIDECARAAGRPRKVIGHHFFSPANIMRLVEIVRGAGTGKDTIAASMKLAKRLNKVGVLVGNCFGFTANRMLAYYMREALLLLEEGAGAPEIDEALVQFGFPVGPFAMQDIAGIDVGWRIREYLRARGRTRAEGPQSPVPDWLYEMGRYGQKTGAGWYRYEPGSRTPIADPLIDELAARAAGLRGISRRRPGSGEIVTRMLTAAANEGARVLEEGMALRAGDIDVIWVHGFGFPRHRGGPMAWAEQTGLPRVLEQIEEYRARLGEWWRPAPLLARLAQLRRGFYAGETAGASSAV